MSKKLISLFLMIILFTSSVLGSYADGDIAADVLTEVFIRQELFRQYSLIYDTFSAAVMLEDGTEITGIGYTDYSAYYEAEDGPAGYFPAGFIADYGYVISSEELEKGLVIENLDFTDDQYQFVFDYETTPFMEHCVRDGQYLKYGVNEQGAITYETSIYERGVCDESLGALFSYDTGKFVFDPDMGNYVRINGTTLFDQIDFAAVEARMNQIIADQDVNFSHEEIVSSAHVAQEAIVSYLLSMQEETFLGYRVSELVESASQLDPMQCIRITPEGFVVIDLIDEKPGTADELTRWLVGAGCLILVAGSIALEIFVPAARPLSGAIMGAAIDVFMQVVVENKSLENVQWGKVAVAAASGAMMAWVCPMAAAGVTKAAIHAGASEVLGKVAGYGVLTFCNSMVAGTTNLAFSMIDGKEDGWNAFLIGAAIGAASTIAASVLSETLSAVAPKVSEILSRTRVGEWVKTLADKAGRFIQEHQVHLKNTVLEDILAPKSVYMAAKSAVREMNSQTGLSGGSYKQLSTNRNASEEVHETPAFSAYNKANKIENGTRGELPAIKMSAEDHAQTASYGNSKAAIQYRDSQAKLIAKGNMHAAIQMDIDDLTTKFGTKYNDEIQQMLVYAIKKGWWKPWAENTGIWSLIMESMDLTLEEIEP